MKDTTHEMKETHFGSLSAKQVREDRKDCLSGWNDGLILLEAEKIHNSTLWTKDTTTELLKEFQRYIGLKFADMKLEFGICQEEKTLLEVGECVKKCQKVLKMGSIIFWKWYLGIRNVRTINMDWDSWEWVKRNVKEISGDDGRREEYWVVKDIKDLSGK